VSLLRHKQHSHGKQFHEPFCLLLRPNIFSAIDYTLGVKNLRVASIAFRSGIIIVYKILFDVVDTAVSTHFVMNRLDTGTRGHSLNSPVNAREHFSL